MLVVGGDGDFETGVALLEGVEAAEGLLGAGVEDAGDAVAGGGDVGVVAAVFGVHGEVELVVGEEAAHRRGGIRRGRAGARVELVAEQVAAVRGKTVKEIKG